MKRVCVARISFRGGGGGARGGICPPLSKMDLPTCVFMLPPKISCIYGSSPLVTFSEINPGSYCPIILAILDFLRFGKGSLSITVSAFLFLEQFPLRSSRADDPCTWRDTVLSRNCLMDGFSFRPPLHLCFPKIDSRRS